MKTLESTLIRDVQASARGDAEGALVSAFRRPAVGAPTVRAVGRRFLQLRPLIVAPAAIANGAALVVSGAPAAQRAVLAASLGVTVLLFAIEGFVARRREVSERWFFTSLALTLGALAFGAALSGGIASPLLPLLLAPIVVAFAAFGRRTATLAMLGCAIAIGAGLASLPSGVPFPPLGPSATTPMALVSLATSLALAFAGVSALVEAHGQAAEVVDRMRLAALEASASRSRDVEQVSATVAHELKNPLGAVRAIVQVLAERDADDRTKKRLAVALSEVDRMRGIVDDYLAFARPLAASSSAEVDLEAIAREVVDLFESRAGTLGVEIGIEGARVVVPGDASRLREAIANLVENAIHASPRGGRVAIEIASTDDEATLRVCDQGSGLPDAIAAAPGAPFVTTKPGGTGLGLAIAKGSIAQHGGALTFARGPDGGTIAVVSLPRARGEAA